MNDLLLRGAVNLQILAQSLPPVPDAKPNSSAPGGNVVETMIGWAKWLGLGVAVLAIIVGALVYGASRMSNNPKAQGGAGRVVMTGCTIAAIIGLAPWAVSLALGLGQSVE